MKPSITANIAALMPATGTHSVQSYDRVGGRRIIASSTSQLGMELACRSKIFYASQYRYRCARLVASGLENIELNSSFSVYSELSFRAPKRVVGGDVILGFPCLSYIRGAASFSTPFVLALISNNTCRSDSVRLWDCRGSKVIKTRNSIVCVCAYGATTISSSSRIVKRAHSPVLFFFFFE